MTLENGALKRRSEMTLENENVKVSGIISERDYVCKIALLGKASKDTTVSLSLLYSTTKNFAFTAEASVLSSTAACCTAVARICPVNSVNLLYTLYEYSYHFSVFLPLPNRGGR